MNDVAPQKISYDPRRSGLRPFHTARARFVEGADSPRAFLEVCLEVIAAREAEVKAFTVLDLERARAAADESAKRYKAGRPLSILDGMPVAVKDVIDTEDFPTTHGSKMFADNRPAWDAPCVYWLKKAGAFALGKTVSTEFAAQPPGPTRNPWDTRRTPGGSSSGSAAAVAAGMAPLGLGTQVRGSGLRPAAYCGTYSIKPSFGVITNHGLLPLSRGINHLCALAASLEDSWLTLHYLSRVGGSEPGYPGLPGKTEVPAATKPARLIRLETQGWADTPANVRALLEGVLERARKDGVEIIDRTTSIEVERVERMLADVMPVSNAIRNWEARNPMFAYYERGKDKMDPETVKRIELDMMTATPEDYEAALVRRKEMQRAFAELGRIADACVTLTAPEPAPLGTGTGNMSYLDCFSVIGNPALTLPLLSLDGMPMGVQMAGFHRADARLVAQARWLTTLVLGD